MSSPEHHETCHSYLLLYHLYFSNFMFMVYVFRFAVEIAFCLAPEILMKLFRCCEQSRSLRLKFAGLEKSVFQLLSKVIKKKKKTQQKLILI